ncbi:MAG: DUF559 domain-containing protein [Acidimicrobiales bacterium]
MISFMSLWRTGERYTRGTRTRSLLFSDERSPTFIDVGVLELDHRLVEIALEHHRLVKHAELSEAGLTRNQWSRRTAIGTWVPIAPGVWRHLATEESWRLRARAVMRWLGDDAALHGRSALHWWGIDADEPTHVDVVVPRSRKNLHGPCRVHSGEWDPTSLRRLDGVRLQEPTRALIAAAADQPGARVLERLIDEAVRRRLTTPRSLSTGLAAFDGSGHAGIRTLRSLLLDTGGESYLERRFLQLVRLAGLPRPRCQVVHRSDGVHVARVDFLFPGTDVVVEVSGRLGHATDRERQKDARRRNALQHGGRVVLEFTTADVLDARDYVVTTLREWLQ